MSALSEQVYELLVELFPYVLIKKEVSLKYKNQQLYFDFVIPAYSIVIEVNGAQHYEFVKFFHQDKESFNDQVKRDKLKAEWADINNHNLVSIDYRNMPKTKEDLLKMIKKEVLGG